MGGLLASVEGSNTYLYCYDANGNVGQMVDVADGSLAANYQYNPFGKTISADGALTSSNPFQFSTEYADAETGLYSYGLRPYSPELGRWLSRDPLGEGGGVNLYVMVWNNPINWVDPYGDSPFSIMAKSMVKKGITKGLKEFSKKQIEKRLKRYMTVSTFCW